MKLLKKKDHKDRMMTKGDIIGLLKQAFDYVDLKYDYKEEMSLFRIGFMGDDLPIGMDISIDEQVMMFRCPLKLKAEEINYQKVVWKLNEINGELTFGSFYLDPEDGYIMFGYGFPFVESQVSPEFLLAFIKMIVDTVDEHDGMLKEIAEEVSRMEYKPCTGEQVSHATAALENREEPMTESSSDSAEQSSAKIDPPQYSTFSKAEFSELRSEITTRISILADVMKFGYTAVVAVWAIAIALVSGSDDIHLYAVPFIMSLSLIIVWITSQLFFEHIMGIGLIGGYISVFYEEDINKDNVYKAAHWETLGPQIMVFGDDKTEDCTDVAVDMTQYTPKSRIKLSRMNNILEFTVMALSVLSSAIVIYLVAFQGLMQNSGIDRDSLIAVQILLSISVVAITYRHISHNHSASIIDKSFVQTKVNWYEFAVNKGVKDRDEVENILSHMNLVKINYCESADVPCGKIIENGGCKYHFWTNVEQEKPLFISLRRLFDVKESFCDKGTKKIYIWIGSDSSKTGPESIPILFSRKVVRRLDSDRDVIIHIKRKLLSFDRRKQYLLWRFHVENNTGRKHEADQDR